MERNMKIIKTIDLWTEQHANHYDCFNGAFSDGFDKGNIPYDSYKIVRNCNCVITNNKNIPIGNKHNAVVFYKNNNAVRLMVLQNNTDITGLINNALNQQIGNKSLKELMTRYRIVSSEIDMREKPIMNTYNKLEKEIDVGSCDRLSLLKNMLSGSYTNDETSYGHFDSTRYYFDKNTSVEYNLKTDKESFSIEHECAFFNDLQSRVIILQKRMWKKYF